MTRGYSMRHEYVMSVLTPICVKCYVVYDELERSLDPLEQVRSVSVDSFFCQCKTTLNNNL
jgi:hypothetical protein